MQYATCINESCYRGALSYGQKYVILGIKDDMRHTNIKIKADNGRVRWYPAGCFDLEGADVPRLCAITMSDSLEDSATSAVTVDLCFSNGQRRWCFFATPDALKQFGDKLDGTTLRIHYGAPHLIIVDQLDAQIIEQALYHIERQGKLPACTLLIEEAVDQPEK